jgi:hypothetical protein
LGPDDVSPPAPLRLYQASAVDQYVLIAQTVALEGGT